MFTVAEQNSFLVVIISHVYMYIYIHMCTCISRLYDSHTTNMYIVYTHRPHSIGVLFTNFCCIKHVQILLLLNQVKICRRPFHMSQTYTVPFLSTHIPYGLLNCPGPFPLLPNDLINSPSLVNIDTRLLPHSRTYTRL